jgi:hypothetical protein
VALLVGGGMLVLSLALGVACAAGLLSGLMRVMKPKVTMMLLVLAVVPTVRATAPNAADQSIERFLTRQSDQHPYRATRRLEAKNGSREGWLEAKTEYSPSGGFRYQITAEGGSSQIRTRVLRAVLDGEQDVIALGEAGRAALAPSNYAFQPNGVDAEGLANVLLSPKRKERALLSGVMFLRPDEGELVRLQGRLAKNPSFWVRNVDIVRKYARIHTAVMPVAIESTAHVTFLGAASFRMTYDYQEIDGRSVRSNP